MKISFYNRGEFVYVRLSNASKCIRFSTGIKEKSNTKLEREKKYILSLYNRLQDFEMVRDEYLSPKPIEDSYMLNNLFNKYVSMMRSKEVLTKSNRPFSNGSINMYSYVSNKMNALHNTIDLSKFDLNISKDKKTTTESFIKFFNNFEESLSDLSISSRSDVMNIASLITQYWANKFYFNIPKIPRVIKSEKPIVVYSPDFTRKFIRDENGIYDTLSEEMKTMWEIAATILITTMRISDVLALSPQHINFTKSVAMLVKRNIKTGSFSEIPIPDALTNKYKSNLNFYGRLYTTIPTIDLVYENIERLFKLYEEGHEIVTVTTMDNQGREVLVSKPMYEWTRPHLLRKTAITTMIYNNVPERFIKFASGHSMNSHTFERYVGHVEKQFRSELNNYYDKLLN